MRTHNEAARMTGGRASAAIGRDPGVKGPRMAVFAPDPAVRAMVSDLVPFEELDSVMLSLAGSTDRLMAVLAGSGALTGVDHEELESVAGSVFFALGQELAYAWLMAGTDKTLKQPAAPERAACSVCSTRFENEPGSGVCAQCYKPVHGGRRA